MYVCMYVCIYVCMYKLYFPTVKTWLQDVDGGRHIALQEDLVCAVS